MKWPRLLVVGVAGIALSGAIVAFSRSKPVALISDRTPQDLTAGIVFQYPQVNSAAASASPGFPVHLKIPRISVDASIEYVGLTPGGAMDITKKPDDVSWYELGPRPGERGSAVIAGHYGTWKDGAHSVFDNLSTLERGDTISVEDDQGATTTFIVRDSRLYDPKSNASDVFESSDGIAHLNLITCDGVWDAISKSYSKRLVVFTDKE